MEWNAVVHIRLQGIRLIVPDEDIAGPAQGSEQRVGQATVEMA